MKESTPTTHAIPDEAWMKEPAEKLISYFSWRQPYRGNEQLAAEAVHWALRQTQKPAEDIAVILLEAVNERNSLRKRLGAIAVISTNSDFVEDATVESVEWAFGKKLKCDPVHSAGEPS